MLRLEIPWTTFLWTAKRSNQSILKEMNPEYSLEGLMLKLRCFGHLMRRANSLEKTLLLGKIEGRRRRDQQKMRLLDGIINSMDTSWSKLQKMVKDREAWHAAVCRVTKSWLVSSGGQSMGVSASVLQMNIQGSFPLGFTGLISLQSNRLSRVFKTTV